ncbi:hypothetical protein CW368_00940 [Actinomycetales bacterium SN12]|nr:hypothetical protein CW368_00940 [Actinomycetales bacterium SN12]
MRISWESLRASMWFWPMSASLLALVLTLALMPIQSPVGHQSWLWPGDAAGASALVQLVGTAVMAAATLTFSITVVALQLASQQFSPRLLREFARDPVTQAVLAVMLSTFVVSLTALRGIRTEQPLPVAVIVLVYVLGIASAGALLAFVGHLVRTLRVDTMMVAVHQEASRTIAQTYPGYGDTSKKPESGLEQHVKGTVFGAARSGFVREIHPEVLVEVAHKHDLIVRLDVRPGDHVVAGAPLGIVWGKGAAPNAVKAVSDRAAVAIEIGSERTSDQDVAFGLRQLTDIAVKAISPGINDPVTAATSLGHSADLLTQLQSRQLGTQAHHDAAGNVRVLTPDRDHRYYLDLVCAPVRRYGSREPIVLTALLRLLRDCARTARDEEQRQEIRRQRDLVLAGIADEVVPADRDLIADLADRVEQVIEGEVARGYRDRAGETRSF